MLESPVNKTVLNIKLSENLFSAYEVELPR